MKYFSLAVVLCSAVGLLQPQVRASAHSYESYDIGAGKNPALASDSAGNLHVAYEGKEADKNVDDIFYSQSSDGGKTWSPGKDVSGTAGTSSHPAVAVEASGGIDVVWSDTTSGDKTPDIYFARSTDSGKTWSKALDISNTPGVSSEPAVATGHDNSIHVVWSDTSKGKKNREIYYCCSSDGGKTWAKDPLLPAVDISNTPGFSSDPAIAVGSDGVVHAAWQDTTSGDTEPDIFYAQCSNDKWSLVTNISHSARTSSRPSLACASKDKVWLTWSDNSVKESASDIWCAVASNGKFAKPLNISDTKGVSSEPSIATGDKGRIAIAWSDTTKGEKRPDIFARVSNDDGSHFSNVANLTNTPGAASKHPVATISGTKMFVVWEEVTADGKSTVKATSMETKDVSTGPVHAVSGGDVDEAPYVDKHKETNYGPWQIVEGSTTFKCIDPHAACSESEQVLETLKEYVKAASRSDFATCAKYMDNGVSTFDDVSKQLIVGKEAVLNDLKARLIKYSSKTEPLLLYQIEHPYAKVTGDMAVVTFSCTKKFGGEHPQVFTSRCTDIWVKEEGMWKKLHFTSAWKEV